MRICDPLAEAPLAAGEGATAFEFPQNGHLGAAAPWREG